jgi:hypothetical protein
MLVFLLSEPPQLAAGKVTTLPAKVTTFPAPACAPPVPAKRLPAAPVPAAAAAAAAAEADQLVNMDMKIKCITSSEQTNVFMTFLQMAEAKSATLPVTKTFDAWIQTKEVRAVFSLARCLDQFRRRWLVVGVVHSTTHSQAVLLAPPFSFLFARLHACCMRFSDQSRNRCSWIAR